MSDSEAKQYLTEWAGIEFDPQVVKAFLALEDREKERSPKTVAEEQAVETMIYDQSVDTYT